MLSFTVFIVTLAILKTSYGMMKPKWFVQDDKGTLIEIKVPEEFNLNPSDEFEIFHPTRAGAKRTYSKNGQEWIQTNSETGKQRRVIIKYPHSLAPGVGAVPAAVAADMGGGGAAAGFAVAADMGAAAAAAAGEYGVGGGGGGGPATGVIAIGGTIQHMRAKTYRLPAVPTGPTVEVVIEPTGTTTVAHRYSLTHSTWKIGISVAGNSGRPGGACGIFDGHMCSTTKLYAGHRTQEEDIVSNWLLTEHNKFGVDPNKVYADTICGVWGMRDPKAHDFSTVQGKDYTQTTNPQDYAEAWVVPKAWLSVKTPGKTYDFTQNFEAGLFFIAGPNASKPQWRTRADSTMLRTYNKNANANYGFFRESVKAAQRANLYAMAKESIDIAFIALVSGALYAGPHKARINAEYEGIINELLRENSLGLLFQKVVLVKLQ